MEKQRIVYFDFLRIFSILAIIVVHVTMANYFVTGIYQYSSCFWNGISRWGVPIFVMISGALFLDPKKDITINNIFKKYIFRIVVLFIVWSVIYTFISCIERNNFSVSFIIEHLILGNFHQWFLYMIAGLYLITPLLRPITEKRDKNLILYLLIIWFIMTSIVPFINFIFPSTRILKVIINEKIYFSFPLYYIGYFILGYYLHNYVNIKNNLILIAILVISFFFIVIGEVVYAIPYQETFFVEELCPFVIITAFSVFLLIKNMCSQIKQSNKVILKMSKLTLGVYLIHIFFIKVIKELELFNTFHILFKDNDFFIIPTIFIVVSLCSFISVYFLSKIPIIKKYCL